MALDRFDAIARACSAAGTRRTLMGALGGGLLALASPLSVGDPTALAAKKKDRKKKKKGKNKQRCPRARRCKKACCKKGQTCQKGVCKKKQTTPTEPGVTRVRRDLHSLTNGELASLERGVAEMKRRSRANKNDPTGWTFQAELHAINAQTGAIHSSIHFLSWHRMYLYHFERILRDAAGDDTLTLPFWDYSVPEHRVIPGQFRDPANELYNDTRNSNVNQGEPPTDSTIFSDSAAMAETNFTHYGMGTSFGGRVGAKGVLEREPHDLVHNWVGGNMGSVPTAPLDPLFWLHHANIDRLWEVWLRQGGGRANPTSGEFLTKSYEFYNENGQKVQMTGRKILDTAAQLHYTYAGQEPLAPAALSGSAEGSLGAAGATRSTVVGSTYGGLKLGSRPVDLEIPIQTSEDYSLAGAAAAKSRTTLTFTGVTGGGVPGVAYRVHVNATSKSPGSDDRSFLGMLTLFGLQPDDHQGHHHATDIGFDITKQVGNGNRIDVTLVPVVLADEGGRSGRTWATVEGAKVSVEGASGGGKNKKQKTSNKKKRQANKKNGKQAAKNTNRTKRQRKSQNKRKRTVNRKQKRSTSTRQGQAATQAASQSPIPGDKSSAFAVDAGAASAAEGEHAHH